MKNKHFLLGIFGFFSSLTSALDVTYSVDGKTYEGFWASIDMKNQSPLVFIAHDWDGLTYYEKQRAEMLNQMGYNVFAMDLFGKGVRPTKLEDKRQHTGELYKDRKKLQKLMNAGIAQAKKLGANTDEAIFIGYCFGGAAVLEVARAGIKAKGFVTFHGGLKTPKDQNYAYTKAPIMVLHGSADTAIPMTDFAKLASELEKYKVEHEMITYSGAQHAFTVFDTTKYQKEADEKSWAAFTRFLTKQTQNIKSAQSVQQ